MNIKGVNCVKIFVAGPRAISSLSNAVKERLLGICNNGFTILVGDADGVDSAVQKYLTQINYPNVRVYASNGKVRNNHGHWPVEAVQVAQHIRGFDFYAMKDNAMVANADYGFMVWNSESKGTLTNIVNLLNAGKKVLVYLHPQNAFHCIDTFNKLENIIRRVPQKTRTMFYDLRKTNLRPEKMGA